MRYHALICLTSCAFLIGCAGSGGVSAPTEVSRAAEAGLTEPESLAFDSQSWDFGRMRDDAGSVSHVYAFLNTSSHEVSIGSVEVSCSCIAAEFSTEPVPAGGMGEITLTFMPAGAVGAVYRTAEVYDGDGRQMATLSMLADVERVDAEIEDLYHFTISDKLLVDRGVIPFGYVYHGRSISKIVRIANISRKPVSLSMACTGTMLSVEYPESIGPRSEAEILLTYTVPDDRILYGVAEDEVIITADGEKTIVPLKASAIYMSAPTGEKPVLWTMPSLIEMKSGALGRRFKGCLEIGNNGESDLRILAVESPVPLPIAAGETIKPGERRIVKVSSPARDFTVKLFTNDPIRPFKELIFK